MEQCRSILEKLENLENAFFGTVTNTNTTPNSKGLPSGNNEPDGAVSFRFPRSPPNAFSSAVNASLLGSTPRMFNVLAATPNARVNISEGLKHPELLKNRKAPIRYNSLHFL